MRKLIRLFVHLDFSDYIFHRFFNPILSFNIGILISILLVHFFQLAEFVAGPLVLGLGLVFIFYNWYYRSLVKRTYTSKRLKKEFGYMTPVRKNFYSVLVLLAPFLPLAVTAFFVYLVAPTP